MKRQIDPLKAIALHEAGRTWTEIGRILAAERGRRSPFQSFSVMRAVRAHDRREPDRRQASEPRR